MKSRIALHWSSEIYSLGKTYREYYKLAHFLPLPFYSDHAPMQSGIIDFKVTEDSRLGSTYLTFSQKCIDRNAKQQKLKILGTLHPWIPYRRKRYIRSGESEKRIVFLPLHTTPQYVTQGIDDQDSIVRLNALKAIGYKPIVCLHWHDLGSEREGKFRNENFEIVTLGDPFESNYVDKFYELASKIDILVAESYTSAIPLMIEFGIPCSIIKRDVQIQHESRKDQKFGYSDSATQSDIKLAEKLFQAFPPKISDEQMAFAEMELGLEFSKNFERNRQIIIKSYLSLFPVLLIRFMKRIVKRR